MKISPFFIWNYKVNEPTALYFQ